MRSADRASRDVLVDQGQSCCQWRLSGVLFLLGLCFVVNLALFAWGINRGLDIKDESYMLLCYRFPQVYADLTTSFHLIVARLAEPLHFGLLQFRWVGFILKMLAAAVFAWGVACWLNTRQAEP